MWRIGLSTERPPALYSGAVHTLASRRRVSLSDLFSEACSRIDITPEEALCCERTKDPLRLLITKDRHVDFELVDDPENERLTLGSILES